VGRRPGMSVRLKLTLSYAGFLMVAGVVLLTPQLGETCVGGVTDFNGVIAAQTTTPEVLPSPYPT